MVNSPDWLYNNQIPIGLLSDWGDPLRDCADWWVEIKLGNLISDLMNTTISHQSVGNFPKYDIIMGDGISIEIKLSSYQAQSKIFVETHKEMQTSRDIVSRKTPSGLLKSDADFYLLLNPGRAKKGEEYIDVMKVRLIETSVLHYLFSTTAEEIIQPSGGKKTYGFNIDLRDPEFTDNCLGHYLYQPSDHIIDFSNFTKYSQNIIQVNGLYHRTSSTKRQQS